MIPTGTPATTNQSGIDSGVLNSHGNRNELIRVHKPDIASPLLLERLQLSFPMPMPGAIPCAGARSYKEYTPQAPRPAAKKTLGSLMVQSRILLRFLP